MVEINDGMNCCGLRELSGLSKATSPETAMLDIATNAFGEIAPKAEGKKVNPYKKPKDKKWQTIPNSFWGDRYWTRDNGERVYEYQAQEWEDGRRYYGDDDEGDKFWRYAVFTQAGKNATYGKKFAALIRREKLGEVVQATTKTVKNPNSGNILKAWVWTVNYPALKKWAVKYVSKGAK